MIFNGSRQVAILSVVSAMLGFLAGCGGDNGDNVANTQESVVDVIQVPKEELVGQRALDRMNALIAMDWEKAYTYLSPARRKILPYRVFSNRMNISAILRKSAEVKQVSCEEAVCDVAMDVTFMYIGGVVSAMQGQQRTSTIHEKWVFSEQNWWFVQL